MAQMSSDIYIRLLWTTTNNIKDYQSEAKFGLYDVITIVMTLVEKLPMEQLL